jgi:hypothetical protein
MTGRYLACRSVLLLVACLVGCGDESDDSGAPVDFGAPAAGVSSGCREALAVASPEACRGAWVCADERTLGLACVRGANASSCACTLAVEEENETGPGGAGGDSGSLSTFDTEEPCTTPEQLRALATSRCQIEVSP